MKKRKHRGGAVMGRSDIPYAQRLAMERAGSIASNREVAAQAALLCASVAMHEVKNVGYKRLVRFSLRFKRVIDEFYEDVEVGMAHAKARMEQMGMPISGELYTVAPDGRTARQLELDNHMLQASQIALICAAIAMNDEFGFGQEVQTRISQRTAELADRYGKEGMGFLLEEMEKLGFKIKDGKVHAFVDDDGNPVTMRKAMEEGFAE